MATTTAIVTTEGLALAPNTITTPKVCPGSRLSVAIDRQSLPTLHPDAERIW